MHKHYNNIVLLVDDNDKVIGNMDKLLAHELGVLHRAFSVFLFNGQNELLLQKRSSQKYHSAGLWSNTCCSHPVTDNIQTEAEIRLKEEMGIEGNLVKLFTSQYNLLVSEDMKEREMDHVYIAYSDLQPKPNPDEVEDYKWLSIDELDHDLLRNEDQYSSWFKILYPKVRKHILENNV